jgi:hypothetical protein
MRTDFVAHHNSITTTPCPASHHQTKGTTKDVNNQLGGVKGLDPDDPNDTAFKLVTILCIFLCRKKTHLFSSLSFTTLLMYTDFVAHHNSITTTPCPASHHQTNWTPKDINNRLGGMKGLDPDNPNDTAFKLVTIFMVLINLNTNHSC